MCYAPSRPAPRVADLASDGPRNALDVHARRDAGEGRARRSTDATGGDAAELRAGAARGVAQRASDAGAERGACGSWLLPREHRTHSIPSRGVGDEHRGEVGRDVTGERVPHVAKRPWHVERVSDASE